MTAAPQAARIGHETGMPRPRPLRGLAGLSTGGGLWVGSRHSTHLASRLALVQARISGLRPGSRKWRPSTQPLKHSGSDRPGVDSTIWNG